MVLSYDFALRACAADETVNGRGPSCRGGADRGRHHLHRRLFRLEGESIQTVTLQVEAGASTGTGTSPTWAGASRRTMIPRPATASACRRGRSSPPLTARALTVAVTFSDGTERSQSYPLRQEQMLACAAAEGETYRPP